MKLYYYNRHDYDTVIPLIEMQIPFHDLTILLDGEMVYHINGERIVLHDGDVIFIPKGTVRTREEIVNSRYVSYNFEEADQEFLPTLSRGLLSNVALHIIFAFDEVRKTTFDLSKPRLQFLFCALLEELRYQSALQKENILVRQIKEYLYAHLREKINLADISQQVFYSIPYIEKIFKEETGTSIMRYLNARRLSVAKNLLMDTALSLKSVAEKSGFPDYNFFSRAFKKYVGCSPLTYRNTHTAIKRK